MKMLKTSNHYNWVTYATSISATLTVFLTRPIAAMAYCSPGPSYYSCTLQQQQIEQQQYKQRMQQEQMRQQQLQIQQQQLIQQRQIQQLEQQRFNQQQLQHQRLQVPFPGRRY
jgi:hypothetical protein